MIFAVRSNPETTSKINLFIFDFGGGHCDAGTGSPRIKNHIIYRISLTFNIKDRFSIHSAPPKNLPTWEAIK